MNGLNMRTVKLILAICTVTVLAGCKQPDADRPYVSADEYAESSSEFEEVGCANIDVSIHVALEANSTGAKSYYADHSQMEVKNIFYKEGDIVKKGDVLVEFKSDDIDDEIRTATQMVEEDRILYEHVLRMKRIYPSYDYSAEEERLLNEIELSEAKRDEYTAWKEAYSIKAEADGVVTMVSSIWQQSKVGPEDMLITVNYTSGVFAGVTTDDYDFAEGGEYDATVGISVRKLVIDSISEEGLDENGRMKRRIEAHLADGIPTDEKEITLDVAKPVLKDALFISKKSAICVNANYFVYVYDENDIPVVRKIEGELGPNDIIIVKDGLKAGERVVTDL